MASPPLFPDDSRGRGDVQIDWDVEGVCREPWQVRE